MNKFFLSVLGLLLISVSAFSKDIRESQVPEQVKACVAKYYPAIYDAEWEYKNKKNSFFYYKVEFEVENGLDVEMEIDTNGNLISLEEELATKDIPVFVNTYVQENYSGATILDVDKKIRDNKTYYDAGIRLSNKKHLNIYLDETGKLIKSRK